MSNLGPSLGWGLVVALSLLAGALAAARLRLPERVAAMLTAFGGGVLLAAVALELVPDADAARAPRSPPPGSPRARSSTWARTPGSTATSRAARCARWPAPPRRGARTREDMARDMAAQDSARGLSITAGLFIDGVPESVALGLTIAEDELGVALLAGVLVGNVVEAYGAAQPIIAGGRSPRFAVGLLGGIGLALALATVLGGTVLADASGELIGTAQGVAAGAVLAVVSIAVIPHAFEEVSRLTAVTTVAGFLAGYVLS